jgi:TIGR02757 family protein
MKEIEAKNRIIELANKYNDECYFANDPIIYPKHFAKIFRGEKGIFIDKVCNSSGCKLQDIEIAGIIAAHLAWGRRDMIVRDTKRAMDEMNWEPYNYVMAGKYKNTNESLHRTIKWSEFANICNNLKNFYTTNKSLEILTPDEIRVKIYGQKSNPKMANKKIHMFRRWMVRNDGIVDLGLWKNTPASELIIPLDVHVHRSAMNLGITLRKGADFTTAQEITNYLKTIFPNDPCLGDFALFAHSVSLREEEEKKRKNGEN